MEEVYNKVVLIEDNDSNRSAISKALEKVGFNVRAFPLGEPALKYLESSVESLILISDIKLPDISGMEILKRIKPINSKIRIILITGYGSIEDAVDAMKMGADDYLTKPLDMFKLRRTVESISREIQLTQEVDHLKARLDKKYGLENIIGVSQAMERVFEQIRLVAPTNSIVLLTGESGTGKELVANAIHQISPRKHFRFLPLNCAAISPTILESELFGHEKGAFTGAVSQNKGKFELADKGTLFMDEISEISPDVQVKLLRVLEGMDFMRVGGSEMIKSDCRIIAATNKDLEKFVQAGKFREDLYYRLKVVSIHLPALRDRPEDIPLLIDQFIKVFTHEYGDEPLKISPKVMNTLIDNHWKGNVRELKNLIHSLVILTKDDEIRLEHLPPEYRTRIEYPKADQVVVENRTMAEIEKAAIENALKITNGNKTQAAKILGIGLRTLQRKLKEYEAE